MEPGTSRGFAIVYDGAWVDQPLTSANDDIDRLLSHAIRDQAIQTWADLRPLGRAHACVRSAATLIHTNESHIARPPGAILVDFKTVVQLRQSVARTKVTKRQFVLADSSDVPPVVKNLIRAADLQQFFIVAATVSVNGTHRDKTVMVPFDEHAMFGEGGEAGYKVQIEACRIITDPTSCALCKAKDETKKCAGCKQVRYCSLECQKQDWTQHKIICKRFAT